MYNSGRNTHCRRGLAGSYQVAFVLLASGREMSKCGWVTRIKKRLKKAQTPQSSFCHPLLQHHSHMAVSLRLPSAPHHSSAAAHGGELAAWMLNCFMPCYLGRNLSYYLSLFIFLPRQHSYPHVLYLNSISVCTVFQVTTLSKNLKYVTCFNPNQLSHHPNICTTIHLSTVNFIRTENLFQCQENT